MSTNPSTALWQQEGYDFMAVCFEVYNEMGHGFLEEVYQESVEIELSNRRIPFVSHPKLQLFYKGQPLRKTYKADLIVIGEIIIELKAVRQVSPEHEAQLINYVRATKKRVGYLVNFGAHPRLEWYRRVL